MHRLLMLSPFLLCLLLAACAAKAPPGPREDPILVSGRDVVVAVVRPEAAAMQSPAAHGSLVARSVKPYARRVSVLPAWETRETALEKARAAGADYLFLASVMEWDGDQRLSMNNTDILRLRVIDAPTGATLTDIDLETAIATYVDRQGELLRFTGARLYGAIQDLYLGREKQS